MVVLVFALIISSIWVYFDAKALGASNLMRNGGSNLSPFGWASFCLVFWIAGFPMYLLKRSEYKRMNGIPSDKHQIFWVLGFGGALVILLIIVLFFGTSKLETPQLKDAIELSIKEHFAEKANLKDLKIDAFNLIHNEGNNYTGLLEVSDEKGYSRKLRINVIYDGESYMWEVKK